jgi:hypothetical protein
MSAALPMQIPRASWIISSAFLPITTSSAPAAMNDAAEAAMPSTTATTFAEWLRSALRIAMPSNTSPPGELTCSWIV